MSDGRFDYDPEQACLTLDYDMAWCAWTMVIEVATALPSMVVLQAIWRASNRHKRDRLDERLWDGLCHAREVDDRLDAVAALPQEQTGEQE